MKKPEVTVWIPTYRRPAELRRLLECIRKYGIEKEVAVIVSDNCGQNKEERDALERDYGDDIAFSSNKGNISAGANFLRAFEVASTEWVHIMGDDDLLEPGYVDILLRSIERSSDSTCAVKFDSSLYGQQEVSSETDITSACSNLSGYRLNDWFNNLLLVSSWLFRREDMLRHMASGYIGYGTKASHILPVLMCSDLEGKKILFSSEAPVKFSYSEKEGWPKAATWVEMSLNMSVGYGYLTEESRMTITRCLFSASYKRLAAKLFRVRYFYRDRNHSMHWSKVMALTSLLSGKVLVTAVACLPCFVVPTRLWPQKLITKLGCIGSAERW